VEAVRKAGLRTQGIDLDAFALVRALAEDSTDDASARVFCHLGGVTNLAIALGNTCLFTRPLSAHDDGEASAPALAGEIRMSIDYYMAQPDARAVGEVVLSGPGSRRAGLAEGVAEHLGLEVRVAEPLGTLDTAAMPEGEDPSRHTVAAGLALGAAA